MKLKPHNVLQRMIDLKRYDEEIYMFVANMGLLTGLYIGAFFALLIVWVVL